MNLINAQEGEHHVQGLWDFLLRGNVVDLAIAVVIGAAFGAVVTSFVENMIHPDHWRYRWPAGLLAMVPRTDPDWQLFECYSVVSDHRFRDLLRRRRPDEPDHGTRHSADRSGGAACSNQGRGSACRDTR